MNRFLLSVFGLLITISSFAQTTVYSTGFESGEGFTASTSYNSGETSFGPEGQQWIVYYGTPSTTSAIVDNQSMQMRWYTSASENLGYTYTDFSISSATDVTFKAASTNGVNVIVYYSTDNGSTWTGGQTIELTTSAADYNYILNGGNEVENVRLKFALSLPSEVPTGTSRLYIDDVVVKGLQDASIVSTPLLSVSGGNYTETFNVQLSCETEGAAVYYTSDGTEPTNASTEYTSAISVSQTTTLKAIAMKDGMTASSIVSATYSFPVVCATIADFLNLELGTFSTITGVVTEVTINDTYGTVTSLKIKDSNDQEILAYGVYRISSDVYEVGQSLTITADRGEYSGEGQIEFTANDGHSIVVNVANRLNRINHSTIEVYPNPFSNQIYVDNADVEAAVFYNVAGTIAKQASFVDNAISTSHLKSGIYIVQLKLRDGSVLVKKVIKK